MWVYVVLVSESYAFTVEYLELIGSKVNLKTSLLVLEKIKGFYECASQWWQQQGCQSYGTLSQPKYKLTSHNQDRLVFLLDDD